MTALSSLFSINGQPVASDVLSSNLLDDRGLAFGHGLFETMLFSDAKLPLLERHLSRLMLGANALAIPITIDLINQYLSLFLNQLCSQSITEGVIKIILTAGSGGRGYQSPDNIVPTLICSYSAMPAKVQVKSTSSIAVRFCNHRLAVNPALAGVKHLNRLDQVIARSEWHCNTYQDGLMFNDSDLLIEAVSANVFLKNNNGEWLTPRLNQVGVKGVMRSLLVDEIFPACNISVSEADIGKTDLDCCQALFICNSVKGLMSVGTVYNELNQQVKSLPVEGQTLMLCKKLSECYPHYQ